MTEFNIYEELMPKIQALISPPDAANIKERSGDLQPYFKKRGKRHNHDYCDACGEKGKVICCDICPASFHLICHDPPLKETEITNYWSCPACKYMLENEQDLSNNSYSDDEELFLVTNDKTSDNMISCQQKHSKMNQNYNKTVENGTKQDDLNSEEYVHIKDEGTISENCEDDPQLKQIHQENPSSDIVSEDSFGEYDKIKIEPQSAEECDSLQETRDDVDIWKIIGVDRNAKINGNKEHDAYSSKEITSNSRKRCKKDESNENSIAKKLKVRDFNITLPNCDYLLKRIHETRNDSNKDFDIQFSSAKKSRRFKKRIISRSDDSEDTFGILRAFDDIITESIKINPRQFTLPIEYVWNIDMNIIGAEKDPDGFPNDLDSNDLIKIPPRRCYYCKGICLTGQMVSCDFCPAHFHLNCLNPPLCNIPDVRWMCPLHPHHILDKVMKNSSSITELMKWWNKLSGPVDDEDVRLKFIKKVSSLKEKSSKQSIIYTAIDIPDIVKYHYKHPPVQIPALQELVFAESNCLFEQEFLLSSHNVIKKSNNCCIDYKESDNVESRFIVESQCMEKNHVLKGCNQSDKTDATDNNSLHQRRTNINKKRSGSLIEISSKYDSAAGTGSIDFRSTERNLQQDNLSTWDEENRNFQFTSCGIYDYESLKGVTNRNKVMNETPWQRIENIILRDIDRMFVTDGVFATKVDNNLKRLLAKEKFNQMIAEFPPSFLPNSHPYPFYPPSLNKDASNILPEKSKGKIRAVLCPLSHRAPLVFMYGHMLNIGRDFSNDVCLANYGKCNFVSEEHAVIFYDESTDMYELLNYSEFSTVVDGVCYTCDISTNKFSEENDLNILNSNNNDITINNNINSNSNTLFENKGVVSSSKRKLSDSNSFTSDSSTSNNIKSKIAGSTVMAAETRSIYKKLLQDIDKLVMKSQEEMASIAEEDLNEISKALKAAPMTTAPQLESSFDKQKTKKKTDLINPSKRNKEKKNSKDVDETDSGARPVPKPKPSISKAVEKISAESSLESGTNEVTKTSSETENVVKPVLQRKPREPAIVLDLSDTIAVRRTKRNVKRSIFTPLRRERKKSKPVEAKQQTEKKKSENGIRDFSLGVDDQVQNSNDDYLSTNDFSFCGKNEKCKCEIKNIKFPNGRDASWEKSAPLFHGSYVKFGCIEFVFSIVNYPCFIEDRMYHQEEKSQSSDSNLENEKMKPLASKNKVKELPVLAKLTESKKDDLSTKLISILNVLSKSSNSSSSRSPSVSNASSRSSLRSSRSSSPGLSVENSEGNDYKGRFEINHEESEGLKCISDVEDNETNN